MKITVNPKLREIMRKWKTTYDVQCDLPMVLKLIVEEHDAIIETIEKLEDAA